MTHISGMSSARTSGPEILNSTNLGAVSILRSSEPGPREKAEQLDRVLRSRTLQNSESLKALLQYIAAKVIEGEDSQLRGNTIAAEVFGRDNFNPSIDSLVRVHTKRLRERLREYYQTEGKSDKILIEIPKGHYNTVFSYGNERARPAAVAVVSERLALPATRTEPGRVRRSVWLRNGLVAAIFLLAMAGAGLMYWNKGLRRQAAVAAAPPGSTYGGVWEPFISSPNPTLVILSNPCVFRFSNASDPAAVTKNAIGMPPDQCAWAAERLKDMVETRQPGKLKLTCAPTEYTGVGEAIGLYRVAELFRSAGRSVTFKQSRTVSAEDLKANNVVMLGSISVNAWAGKIPVTEELTYMTSATIRNNNPLKGEQAEYRPQFDESTGELVEDYALITVRPGVTTENTVMVLAGIESEGTQAAAEFVTTREYLNILNQQLRQVGGGTIPRYYQALLRVGVDNGIPTTVSVVTIHPLKVTRNS
ncbi:MAG TPA: hypothetical protein VI756_22410 [Blastocatellia bacterium]